MARSYLRHHIDTTLFDIGAAMPEMQNAQANARDNSKELASEAFGGVNKQLYDFVANALQMTLANVLGSQTVEFKKLSQQIYSNIVEIVEGKMADGDIAESMLENLDVYNQEGSTESTSTTTEAQETQEREATEPVAQSGVETETIQPQTTIITNVEKITKEETIVKPQEIVKPTTEVINSSQIETNVEVQRETLTDSSSKTVETDTSAAEEKYQSDMDSTISTANNYAAEIDELRTKLRLALVYLRSQKVDIFKILASADEDTQGIVEKQEEIDLDYEEEMRERKNLRKAFDKETANRSEWYKKTFGKLDEWMSETEEQPEGKGPKAKGLSFISDSANALLSIIQKGKFFGGEKQDESKKVVRKTTSFVEKSSLATGAKETPTESKGEERRSPRRRRRSAAEPITRASVAVGPRTKSGNRPERIAQPRTTTRRTRRNPLASVKGAESTGIQGEKPKVPQLSTESLPKIEKPKEVPVGPEVPKEETEAKSADEWKSMANYWKGMYFDLVKNKEADKAEAEAAKIQPTKSASGIKRLFQRIFRRNPKPEKIVRFLRIETTFVKSIEDIALPQGVMAKVQAIIDKGGPKPGGEMVDRQVYRGVLTGTKPSLFARAKNAVKRGVARVKGAIKRGVARVKGAITRRIASIKKKIADTKKAVKAKITRVKNKALRILTFGILGRQKINWKKEALYWRKRGAAWTLMSDYWRDQTKEWKETSELWRKAALAWKNNCLTESKRFQNFIMKFKEGTLTDRVADNELSRVSKNIALLGGKSSGGDEKGESKEKEKPEEKKSLFGRVKGFVGKKIGALRDRFKAPEQKPEEEKKPSLLQKVKDTILGKFKSLSAFKKLPSEDEISSKLATKMRDIGKSVSTRLQGAKAAVTGKVQAVRTAVGTRAQNIRTAVSTKVQGVKTAISNKAQAIGKTVSTKVKGVKEALMAKSPAIGKAIETVRAYGQKVRQFFGSLTEKSLFSRGVSKAKDFVGRGVSRAWGKAKEVGQKVWDKTKEKAKVVASKVWTGAKKVGKKVWTGAKKVFQKGLAVAKKFGAAAYKVGRKVVKTAYKASTKAITKGLNAAGKGLKQLGSAAKAIPYVGVVLGPILMGLGTGLSATSKFLGVAFKAIGRISAVVVKAVENAVKSFDKVIGRMKSGVSSMKARAGNAVSSIKKGIAKSMSKISGVTINISKGVSGVGEQIKTVFSNIGRMIKSWTARWYYGAFTRMIEKAADSMKYRPKIPKFRWKAIFGDKNVRKEAQSVIKSMYDGAVNMTVNASRSGFQWIKTVTKTLSGAITGILSSIGQRMSILGTIGFKGFLDSILSWKILLPIGIFLLFMFRRTIIPWIKNNYKKVIRGIANAAKSVLRWLKKAYKWTKESGGKVIKWLWNQTDPNRRWSLAWIMINAILPLIKTLGPFMMFAIKIFSWLGVGPFNLGMAFAGFWGPALGQLIYKSIKRVVGWLVDKFVKSPLRKLVSWIVPETILGIEVRSRVFRWLRLASAFGSDGSSAPMDQQTRDLDSAVEDLMTKSGEALKAIKLGGKVQELNAALSGAGFPGLDKLVANFGKVVKENNVAIKSYTNFLQEASPHLLDIDHVAQFTSSFYTDEAVSRALLSVFFFTDPLSGNIIFLIPKENIPNVVKMIQTRILESKSDPKKLVKANRDILSYFDYMNVGRSVVLDNITKRFQSQLSLMGSDSSKGKEHTEIKALLDGLKSGEYLDTAMKKFHDDMANKAAGIQANGEIASERTTIEGGDLFSSGSMSLMNVSTGSLDGSGNRTKGNAMGGYGNLKYTGDNTFAEKYVVTPAKGMKKQPAGGMTIKESITGVGESAQKRMTPIQSYEQGVANRRKREEWKRYNSRTATLRANGNTDDQIKAAGYGKTYEEWSKDYDAKHGIEHKPEASPKPVGRKIPVVPKIPKIELPKITFGVVPRSTVSLPGLTRDLKEGTEAHSLYKTKIAPAKPSLGEKIARSFEAGKARREKNEAWKRYNSRTATMRANGETDAQIKAAGYGMSYEEWSKNYDARKARAAEVLGKDKDEKGVSGPAIVDTKAVEPGGKDDVSAARKMLVDEKLGGIDPSSILGGVANKQKALAEDIAHLDIGLVVKPKIPKVMKMEGEGGKEKTPIAELGKLELPSDGSPIKDEMAGLKEGPEKLEKLMMAPPKEEDITPQIALKDEELEGQGISLMSDAQWVSAQEAHQMEQRLISNAKDIRDIIAGLNIMVENLDSAKLDMSDRLEKIKNNPTGEVVELPPRIIPQQVVFRVHDKDEPEYDPLPALYS